ncbi:sigma-70 family RNA polymerase sigma factor [Paenibacillus sp. RC67]|uniref:sigma-70 family RNA polymerase sigma factor n=1 Tax=Paenibacillus sp. RC67 TaxID=3039392 RepID=UPI0024AD09ED|nr:sigma-70 family RNA polymerase sigma factor [Paenibacillus sp. RC67]
MTELELAYTEHRKLLLSIAYRMLGSYTDAEDIVQDAFVALQRGHMEDIRSIKAYLLKTVTHRCLNHLKSFRKQKEVYTGPWLPEPDIEVYDTSLSPEEQVMREESVSYAILVTLQQLSPMERAIFLLREVLDYDYSQMAEILDKSETNCRKMFSRVKQKLNQGDNPTTVTDVQKSSGLYVQAFMKGVRTGNFEGFVHLLTEQATLVSDGGGKVRAAVFPIFGKDRIQAFLEGIQSKGSFGGELLEVRINGDQGLLLIQEGRPKLAICFGATPQSDSVKSIFFILNPDKLGRIRHK